MRSNFDALSFWVTVCGRERGRTFAGIYETNGVRILDDAQAEAHRKKRASLAGTVTNRFQLTPKDLYDFLRKLIGLLEAYERRERYRLSESVRRDIFAWEDLLMLTTGETRDEVAKQLGQASKYDMQTFRQLDTPTKERDYALKILDRVSEGCSRDLASLGDSQWSFTEANSNDLLDYCGKRALVSS